MGKIISLKEITPAEYAGIKSALGARILSMALGLKLAEIDADLEVREITPDDLGLANETWLSDALVTNTESPYMTEVQLEDYQIVAFYGFANIDADPGITKLKFWIGHGKERLVNSFFIEQMYAYENPVMLIDPRIIYKPQSYVNIDVFPTKTKAGGEHLILKGLVCEPKSI